MPLTDFADAVNPPIAPSLPSMQPTVLARLRLETRAEHEAVERVLDLMSASMTRDGYRQRLQQFYGFYAPLEQALQARHHYVQNSDEAALSSGTQAALAARLNKTGHLRHDLTCLGVSPDALPLCRDLPPLTTQAEVLGCLYVLEGATLGGRMITQHVQATFGIMPATGGSFFEGYGADTGKMWHSMRQLLVSGAPDLQSENAMVASATATFACLRRWCESGHKPSVTAAIEATRHA